MIDRRTSSILFTICVFAISALIVYQARRPILMLIFGILFAYACVGGVSAVLPVDLHIRGCPPSPITLLKGLLVLLETVQTSGDVSVEAGRGS